MHPVLFQFEWLHQTRTVQAYGAALLVAGIVFCLTPLLIGSWRDVPRRTVLTCLLLAAPALVLGSRLLFWATTSAFYRYSARHLFSLTPADFSLFGGLLLATFTVVVLSRMRNWNAWAIADVLTPGTALAIAIARVGCFLNGCCLGVPTDLPWAVTYPSGGLAHLHQAAANISVLVQGPRPVHPTQLYELAASLSAATLAVYLLRRRTPPGVPFLAAATCYCAFRLLNDPFRLPGPTPTAPPWLFPVLYASLTTLCATVLTLRWHRPHTVASGTSGSGFRH